MTPSSLDAAIIGKPQRSPLSRTSTSASEYATPWWSTGASWLSPPPDPWRRSRCGGGLKTRAVSALPRALIGGCPPAVASSRDRDAPDQAGGHRVSMASARVRGVWRGDPRPMARGGPQWHLGAPGAGDGVAVYGVVALVEAHDAANDGRGVWRTDACGDAQPVGAGHDRGGSRARRGSPQLRPRARGGTPRGDQRASGWLAGLVLGGSDALGDGMFGADVPWGPRCPRAGG